MIHAHKTEPAHCTALDPLCNNSNSGDGGVITYLPQKVKMHSCPGLTNRIKIQTLQVVLSNSNDTF